MSAPPVSLLRDIPFFQGLTSGELERAAGLLHLQNFPAGASLFSGEQAMLSVVTLAPHAQGTLHHHPEEQWGVLLDGSAIRVQGDEEIPVKKGDFWRTPGNVPHTMRAGPDGARVLDIFSPPRPEYRKAGSGFGTT